MKRWLIPAVLVCLLLAGCTDIFDGSYSSTQPHAQSAAPVADKTLQASNRDELYDVMEEMVRDGKQSAVIGVAAYDQSRVEPDMRHVVESLRLNSPIAAYAMEDVTFELGKSEGQPALSVTVAYRHDSTQIKNIKYVDTVQSAAKEIYRALDRCEASTVLYITNYEATDFLQIVEDYALQMPQSVMEVPQVSTGVYPDRGEARVVELTFTYQTSRDSLKTMQEQVAPVFSSAELYVSTSPDTQQKFAQLSAFLTERFERYQLNTSITPTYSLLCHGVGDSRAFAVVYAALCRQAGLDCVAVSGTKDGQSYYWNMICIDGLYFHVDLLSGDFQELTDEQMGLYVWDYSAYPACDTPLPEPPAEEN